MVLFNVVYGIISLFKCYKCYKKFRPIIGTLFDFIVYNTADSMKFNFKMVEIAI